MQLEASGKDRFLSLTTICFDIAGLEIYLPLLMGATLILATREQAMDPEELSDLIKREAPTIMQVRCTPSSAAHFVLCNTFHFTAAFAAGTYRCSGFRHHCATMQCARLRAAACWVRPSCTQALCARAVPHTTLCLTAAGDADHVAHAAALRLGGQQAAARALRRRGDAD
jgi:AMP-binding enzyme